MIQKCNANMSANCSKKRPIEWEFMAAVGQFKFYNLAEHLDYIT